MLCWGKCGSNRGKKSRMSGLEPQNQGLHSPIENRRCTFDKKMQRSWDRPRTGTIYRMPDDPSRVLSKPRPGRLYMQPVREPVRGVTFTIMPDGKHMRVPVMNRQVVRAANQGHAGNESTDILKALQDIIKGRKPVGDRPRYDGHGRVRRPGGQRQQMRPDAGMGRGGLRPAVIARVPITQNVRGGYPGGGPR